MAIPDDVDAPAITKAQGIVELPLRVRWSGPARHYDLADRQDRALVYEQVLTEGTEDDVRHFVEIDQLVELWPDLVLPRHVRATSARWLRERRSIVVAC